METRDAETTTPDLSGNPSAKSAGGDEMARALLPTTSTCTSCGSERPRNPVQDAGAGRSYIYAIGRIESRFPSVSAEKEFAQVLGRIDTIGKTDREAYANVLSDPHNLYLARQLCWVMSISGIDTYLITPRNPSDFGFLVESVRPSPDPGSLDAIIGTRGPMAPPDMCNGLILPVVFFDHMYSFDRQSLLKSIPKPDKSDGKEIGNAAAEVLDRILASTDNAGATDADRALNYLALRDPGIYARTANCFARDLALTGIEVRPWRLSVARRIVEVVFTFTHRKNEFTEKYCARVDVNDGFPFLTSKIAPYYEH
jgi:PatG Domain